VRALSTLELRDFQEVHDILDRVPRTTSEVVSVLCVAARKLSPAAAHAPSSMDLGDRGRAADDAPSSMDLGDSGLSADMGVADGSDTSPASGAPSAPDTAGVEKCTSKKGKKYGTQEEHKRSTEYRLCQFQLGTSKTVQLAADNDSTTDLLLRIMKHCCGLGGNRGTVEQSKTLQSIMLDSLLAGDLDLADYGPEGDAPELLQKVADQLGEDLGKTAASSSESTRTLARIQGAVLSVLQVVTGSDKLDELHTGQLVFQTANSIHKKLPSLLSIMKDGPRGLLEKDEDLCGVMSALGSILLKNGDLPGTDSGEMSKLFKSVKVSADRGQLCWSKDSETIRTILEDTSIKSICESGTSPPHSLQVRRQ
jgi:hypothetical protein